MSARRGLDQVTADGRQAVVLEPRGAKQHGEGVRDRHHQDEDRAAVNQVQRGGPARLLGRLERRKRLSGGSGAPHGDEGSDGSDLDAFLPLFFGYPVGRSSRTPIWTPGESVQRRRGLVEGGDQ